MKWRSRLLFRDLIGTGLIGLRSRRGRTILTALGIAIGIASMVSVVGISSSSKAALLAEIDSYGTNLLKIETADTGSQPAPLPVDAQPMVEASSHWRAVQPARSTLTYIMWAILLWTTGHWKPLKRQSTFFQTWVVDPHY